ncbi:MAG: trigger factor [Tenericutes bacterium]|nr:trigger factor [Mycoplasmatota bacterium]MDD6942249.1 trigger factor [bacterium]MDY2697548.1 trigger factor [Bacilli bacterium]MDY5992412.1 trigger factor [Bacilli bacterium]
MAKETKTKEIKKEETKKNVHEVPVKIEGEQWTKALDKSFAKKQKTAKVDGFRTGKVPRDIYEKHYGKESLFLEAADLLLQEAYLKAMEDSKLVPVVQPSVDLKGIDENGVEFVFTIVTKPEVNVKKYKGLNIKPEKVEVTDEEINHELGHLLERYTELVNKEDGAVESGDVAVIDFEGFKDGVAFDGGKGENYSLEIGSNTFIPGFEDQIIGMKSGEEKDLDITFPEDYGAKDLAGAKVVFKVKVNEIKTKEKRELDEEFFEDLGMEGVNSEETLKEEIKKSIEAQKEAEAENNYIDKILEEVSKNVEVDIPEPMVDEEVNRLLKRFEEQMKMQGISLDLYYQFTNSNEEALKSQMEKEAYSNVLYRLMLEEIMNLEKIEVSSEEAEKEAEELAKKYQMEKDEFLAQFGGIEMIQYDLEMRKAIELLKELNK